jgi:Mrp family chromosome partitioning ATPase
VLRVQPLGWVLEAKNDRSREFAQEQIRRLALAIDRQRKSDNRRIFVLTSLKPGGGTTELALKVARQLDGIGVRALSVETNAYEADDRFGGDATGPGLGAVLRGEAELRNAIRAGSLEENLPDRVPVGALEERQIHESGRLIPSLRGLEEQYDIFLLDAPPLLVSADAELLCGMADAVLLVVEAEGVTVGELRRAAKQLDQISPPIMGVVVNRVRMYGTGYFKKLIREYESGERLGGPGLLGKLGLARRH